jgi:hypothetical protein
MLCEETDGFLSASFHHVVGAADVIFSNNIKFDNVEGGGTVNAKMAIMLERHMKPGSVLITTQPITIGPRASTVWVHSTPSWLGCDTVEWKQGDVQVYIYRRCEEANESVQTSAEEEVVFTPNIDPNPTPNPTPNLTLPQP